MKSRAYLRGYMAGYMGKQAGPIGTGVSAGVGGAVALYESLLPFLIAAPPVAGAGLGMMHSKLESPTMQDRDNVQHALESAELDEAIADLERNKAKAKLREKQRAKKIKAGKGEQERSLHI
jgi:hypothetical protein